VLFLVFQMGGDRYAIDAGEIAQVLPLVEIKRIPRAPGQVAGVFDFRGSPVPLVDLGQVALDRPSERRLSTRIILVDYLAPSGEKRLLGLIAERVTETARFERADFVPAGVTSHGASYLGPVATDAHGLIQWILVDRILPDEVRAALFQEMQQP
jgi:chemotaxis-related protein WspB